MSSAALAAEAAAAVVPAALRCPPGAAAPGAVRHVYVTRPGDGPRVLAPGDALADAVTGLPFVVAAAHDGAFDKAL